MRAIYLNPNSSPEMSDLIAEKLDALNLCENTVMNPSSGPSAIQTLEDEEEAVLHSLNLVKSKRTEVSDHDVLVVACYGDPGLKELRNQLDIPVVGIAQLSMGAASLLDKNFGLIVAMPSAISIMSDLAAKYGHQIKKENIIASGASVLEMVFQPEQSYERVLKAAKKLVANGVGIACLGCASMGQFAERLRQDSGIIVLDPIESSNVLINSMYS